MAEAKEFYKQDYQRFKAKQSRVRKHLLSLSLARLVVFVLILTVIFVFFNTSLYIAVFGVPLLIVFFWLLTKYSNKKSEEQYAVQRMQINELELRALEGDYSDFPIGDSYRDSNHAYSEDIDLFGTRSFFQYLTRCQSKEGETYLAELLKSNTTDAVLEKQKAVKNLAENPEWRLNYMAIASMLESKHSVSSLVAWLESYTSFSKPFFRWLPKVFSILSIAVLILFAQDFINVYIFLGWLAVGFIIANKYQKQVGELTQKLAVSHELLSGYARLLEQIESADFTSDILKEKQAGLLQEDGITASQAIADLAKGLQSLEHSSNLLVKGIGNPMFLYDLLVSYPVEQWLEEHSTKVAAWLETAAYFEAQNSLANLAYNHPEYTYPKIAQDNITFKAEELAHPLLLEKQAIPSDVYIGESEFLIITGANMAGKSTFLRSVSLAVLMANIGLPIRAKEVSYTPIPLLTSMRTTDSLDQETSYFFAELKRLRFIVDNLEKQKCFVILDEILKGTNSTDKADGSIRFIKKLVSMQATGMVATHDLSLCSIADQIPNIKNFFFDTQIKDEELYFDYRLKPGVCSDRNASFLLRKMKIVE